MITSYPSPKQLGDRSVRALFDGPVLVQEKVDGSQISFSVDSEGTLQVKSRGSPVNVIAPDKMFAKAVEHLNSIKDRLTPGIVYRGEYLWRPKHNVLCYDRVPKGTIALFDVDLGTHYVSAATVAAEADRLGLEAVPVLFEGVLSGPEALRPMLDRVSFLGGAKIEGVVVKNYALATDGEATFAAKFVSEEFKETHAGKSLGAERSSREADEPIEKQIVRAYKSAARWQKAVQHLREDGRLTDTPKDIGMLVKEVQADIEAECGAEIREALYQHFASPIKAGVIDGLALWYKDQLMKRSFETESTAEVPDGV